MDVNLNVEAQLDAGGRLRTSQMNTQLDIKQIHDMQPMYYDRESIGTGSQVYTASKGGTVMTVLVDGDAEICQSKMRAAYFAGKSQFVEITYSDMAIQHEVSKRVGYFSSNIVTPFDSNKDGLWLECDKDHAVVVEKNGVVLFKQSRKDWENPLKGFNVPKFGVLVSDFLYLGGTAVRFGFFLNGGIKWFTKYVHAGQLDETFLRSPQQPLRWEIRSTGGAGTFTQMCGNVASEGSTGEAGKATALDLEELSINANDIGTEYALIGIRLKEAYKDVSVTIDTASLLSLTNDDLRWALFWNPTVDGTFEYNDVPNSALQVAYGDAVGNPSVNHLTAQGVKTKSGYFTGNSSLVALLGNNLKLGSNIDGTKDTYVLAVKTLTINAKATGSINLEEFL